MGDVTINGTALGTPSEMALRFVSAAPLPDVSMPRYLSLANFTDARGGVRDESLWISFRVTSLTERIPEAGSTALLLLLALAALGFVRRS